MSDIIDKINTGIRWCFYVIFLFVPLVMWPDTFELFEFNKMWLVFGFSLMILFLWGSKMILSGKFEVKRTPLDIPILLFLASQVIATFASMEPYVSYWGYYSRFNGGLLSTISYIFLYYAFVTNFDFDDDSGNKNPIPLRAAAYLSGILLIFFGALTSLAITGLFLKIIYLVLLCFFGFLLIMYAVPKKPLITSLVMVLTSGVAVTLWGLPSHFGYDLTCLAFRGTFDTSCWTVQFQPTVRMFSTLGQPNWLGTFLAAIIPITIGFGIFWAKHEPKKILWPGVFLGLTLLFYIANIYANSQSSYLGLAAGIAVFFLLFTLAKLYGKKVTKAIFKEQTVRYAGISVALFALVTFIFGSPVLTINKYATFGGLSHLITKGLSQPSQPVQQQPADTNSDSPESFSANPAAISGGTESSRIRLIVWQGAIELFKRHLLFGTGVETYAYAYYNVKPLAHNLTSEWDYLYNKAHNEYLNYAATTGIFGIGTYFLIIGFFLFYALKNIIKDQESSKYFPIQIGIVGGYVAILVSNFFGFSVVPINLLFFLFPGFYFALTGTKFHTFAFPNTETSYKHTPLRVTFIVILGLICLYHEIFLINFWAADRRYALGYNLDKTGEYPTAYTELTKAVEMLPQEDLYKDELSINMATLALLLSQNNRATEAAQMGQAARQLSDELIVRHSKNIVYYKTRIRAQYALSQLDPGFLDQAIETAKQARIIAPTDAKLTYNIALFYIEKNDSENATKFLDETLRLKPNYIDPRYAKAVLYADLAKTQPARAAEYGKIAKSELEYILTKVDPTHKASQDLLKTL
jgi:tetratricopeptide (TPR) repeat protein